jgi:hypothetical protein
LKFKNYQVVSIKNTKPFRDLLLVDDSLHIFWGGGGSWNGLIFPSPLLLLRSRFFMAGRTGTSFSYNRLEFFMTPNGSFASGSAPGQGLSYQCSLYARALSIRERAMEEILDETRNWEEISDETRNRKTISPETVPCGLAQHQQEESISLLADDAKQRPIRSDFKNDIHTMIKRSNKYATWKTFADEKNLEINLPETKAKDKCCVRLVIFWSFYPQRADNRQPCQEEVERVIYVFRTQCNTRKPLSILRTFFGSIVCHTFCLGMPIQARIRKPTKRCLASQTIQQR